MFKNKTYIFRGFLFKMSIHISYRYTHINMIQICIRVTYRLNSTKQLSSISLKWFGGNKGLRANTQFLGD